MMSSKGLHLSLATACLLFLGAAHAEIYKCRDAEGGVQFTDQPCGQAATVFKPPAVEQQGGNDAARKLKTQRLLRAYQEERLQEKQAVEKEDRERQQRERNCNSARDRLRSMLEAGRLYELDAGGSRVVLTDEQRKETIRSAREAVTRWCDAS